MGDLVVFVAIVGLMVVVGIAMGMIVAGRIDRIMAPPPKTVDPAAGVAASAAAATAATASAGTAPAVEEQHP